MNALIILALSSTASAQSFGPYTVTLPEDFTIAGRAIVDQDINQDGNQVNVWVTHSAAARVNFWTSDMTDRNQRPIARTSLGVSIGNNNGWVNDAMVACGKVVAYGMDTNGRPVMWTPSFNGGGQKQLDTYLSGTDTDTDGLSDITELSLSCTDPTLSDTDGGGEKDSAEIAHGTNPIDAADDYDRDMDGYANDIDPNDNDASVYNIPDQYTGDLEFTGANAESDMIAFCEGYGDASRTLDGYVWIHDADIATVDSLHCLSDVSGQIAISNAAQLEDVDGFSHISSIGGSLSLYGLESLQSVAGFSAVNRVGGSIEISSLPLLGSLEGLDGISTVEGDLYINENAALISMDGVEAMQMVQGSVILSGNPSLSDLSAMAAMGSIGSSLVIYQNASLSSLSDLTGLSSIGNVLWIEGSPAMRDLSGLEGIVEVQGLVLTEMDGLQSLSGLDNLYKVKSTVEISYNDSLVDMGGLDGLGYAVTLLIDGNASLSNLNGLSNLGFLSEISITGNASLVSLQGLGVITQLSGNLTIENNAQLQDLAGLSALTAIGGNCVIASNSALPEDFAHTLIAQAPPAGQIIVNGNLH